MSVKLMKLSIVMTSLLCSACAEDFDPSPKWCRNRLAWSRTAAESTAVLNSKPADGYYVTCAAIVPHPGAKP